MIDGRETSVWDLKKGMNVTATVLTQVPQTAVAEQREVTGKMPAPPPTPPMEGALLIEAAAPEPAVTEAALPKKLPQTGSIVPLLGLIGILSLAGSFGLTVCTRK